MLNCRTVKGIRLADCEAREAHFPLLMQLLGGKKTALVSIVKSLKTIVPWFETSVFGGDPYFIGVSHSRSTKSTELSLVRVRIGKVQGPKSKS
jgi:hypothetical protein